MTKPLDTLWYTRCPVPTGLGIAVQQGFLSESFAQQQTKIESLRESDQESVRESHFDHTLQNSVRHGGNIPAIWARSIGRETRVLGLSWADETQRILTLPDSGIATVKDLKGRKVGLPSWPKAQIDFSRAHALRGLENALKLDGLAVSDVEIVDYVRGDTQSAAPAIRVAGTQLFSGRGRNDPNANELVGLLRREVDAIFLKGAQAAHTAAQFGLVTVIDTGIHPDPLIRANNGTPRTLTVDLNLIENHFDSATLIVEQVLRAEAWARVHPDETRRFLARESNTSEYYVTEAYGENAHERLRTDFSKQNLEGIQDFIGFLHRWNFIPNAFRIEDWIDSRPYEAALGGFKATG